MSKQKISNETEVDNICITNGSESQSNIAVKPVFTAFVVANVIAFSTTGGISGRTPVPSGYFTETCNMTTIEYPSINIGPIGNKKKKEIVPQAKIQNGNTLVYREASEVTAQSENDELRRENAMLKNRLNNSLPIHSIFYISINSVIVGITVILLLLRYVSGIYTIDPYFIICALIIAVTLLGTAIISLKDWKNFLNETK